MKISIRIKKAVLYTLIAAFLLPITQIYSNPTQPPVSPSLAAKIEQAEAEIREKRPQTQEEALQLFKTFINSLSPEERAEFENLRQTIEEQASARPGLQLSPALQAKIQALQEKVLNGIDPQTLTPEKAAALEEEILSQLTPEERAEVEKFQQAFTEQQAPKLSPGLQAKIEKVHKQVFKDIDLNTITPEEHAKLNAQFEEQLSAELTPEEQEEFDAVMQPSQDINRQILSKVLEQLDGFARIGQFLADAMHNEQVKPKDPKKVLEYVQDIALLNRQVKDQFSQESNISLNTIINLVHLCNYLGNHLRYSIVTNLNDIKPLSIETALTRGNSSHINSPEDLEKEFEKNNKLLAELDAQAQSIGLAWYQKGYRQLEALDTKYNLRGNAFKLSIVGAIAAIAIYNTDADTLKSIPILSSIKNQIGDQLKHDQFGLVVGHDIEHNLPIHDKLPLDTANCFIKNYSKFGRFYDAITIQGFFNGNLVPAVGIGSLYSYLLPDAIKWYAWSQEKLSNLATKLRGARAQYVFGGRREPHLTFDNQIGQTHIKDQMSRYISYLLDNKAYDHRGIGITCNVLFAGKSRTGKTYMAEAFVGELNRQLKTRGKDPVQFLIFSKLDIEKFGFKYILEYARDNAPCVVFIDEIDMLGLQPDQNSALLQEFLTALSGATESKLSGVCFLGATNRPESLYKSLLKRFDKVIWFDYPPYEDRKAAFAQDLSNHAIIASPAFIDRIARESEGCSFEDLHKIIVYASQQAETERRAVTENDLQTAVDSVIWKIEQKQCTAPQTQKQIMAAHLAGEALTRVLLPCHYKLAKVTLRDVAKEIREMPSYARYYKEASDQTHNSGKVLTYEPYHGTQINNAEQVHNECKTYLAGHIAEKVLLGQSSHIYCEANTSRALGLAKFLVLEGADLDQLPKEIKNKKTLAAYNLVETYKAEIETLLINNKATLETIAQELMKRETLSRAEIEAIIKRTSTNAQRAE